MGYLWDPVVRIVPRNGSATTIVFAEALSDLAGHERADVRYIPEASQRRDINRSERPVLFGWRPEVRFDFLVMTMADQHAIAQILDGLMDPCTDVYLAMDACTFRRVVLSSSDGPDPIAGKTFAGARFRIGVRCAEMISENPRMAMTENLYQRDWLQNGDFERWNSGVAASWNYLATAGGTITQVTGGGQRSGASAMAFTRSSGATLENGQTTIVGLEPGRWYTLTTWGKGSAAIANGHRVMLRAEDRVQRNVTADGKTWSTDLSNAAVLMSLTTSYAQGALTFRVRPDFLSGDRYSVYCVASNIGTSEIWTLDDFSLVGPVLPAGVSLW
jgi:hypothetical protein